MNFTTEQVDAYLAKRSLKRQFVAPAPHDAVAVEADLHEKIEAWLKQNQWYYVHSRMDVRTTTQLGVPDFIIAAPEGKTYWIECKKKNGKLRPAQTGALMMLEKLNHRWAVVMSMSEFLGVINGPILQQKEDAT